MQHVSVIYAVYIHIHINYVKHASNILQPLKTSSQLFQMYRMLLLSIVSLLETSTPEHLAFS